MKIILEIYNFLYFNNSHNFPATKANDEIVFDITELEITNNGNLIIGKNGKALLNDEV